MLPSLFRRAHATANAQSAVLPLLMQQYGGMKPMGRPLVLVSQIARSGGTWLNQLFDHHPELWTYPLELKIGHPRKWHWPESSNLTSPEQAWETLSYPKADARLASGRFYRGSDQTHPIVFDLQAHRALFIALCNAFPPQRAREWVDAFLATFFFSWLDHQRRYSQAKYMTAFVAMLAMEPESVARFRNDYPDGWLVSIIREPLGWYQSVKQRMIDYPDRRTKRYAKDLTPYAGFSEAQTAYLANVKSIQENARLFGERFILVDYDRLLADTEKTMRRLAEQIGISWHPSLLQQTFNGMPIKPNSSFESGPGKKQRSILDAEETAAIENGAMMQAYATLVPSPAASI